MVQLSEVETSEPLEALSTAELLAELQALRKRSAALDAAAASFPGEDEEDAPRDALEKPEEEEEDGLPPWCATARSPRTSGPSRVSLRNLVAHQSGLGRRTTRTSVPTWSW